MIDWMLILVLGTLIVASYLDLKYRAVPSVFLTSILFIVLVMRIENLQFGVMAFVFAWFMKDVLSIKQMEFGVADIKILTMIGLLISTMNGFLIFIGIFAIFQFIYTLVWQWKVGSDKERPFIPCLLAVYIALLLIEVSL